MQIDKQATTSSTIDCHEIKSDQNREYQKAELKRTGFDEVKHHEFYKFSSFDTKPSWLGEPSMGNAMSEKRELQLGFKDGQESEFFEVHYLYSPVTQLS